MAPVRSVTAEETRPFLPGPARAAVPPAPKVRYCAMSRCEACGLCAWLTFGALLITWAVCTKNPKTPNVDQNFIDQQLGGDPVFGWGRLPVKQAQETYWSLRDQLSSQSTAADDQVAKILASSLFGDGLFNLTWGKTSAALGPKLMYQGTKVPGLFEKVPEKLRGVFWMNGNGVGEILVSLQNGQYFPDQQVHIAPVSPFSWAWPDADDGLIPKDAPYFGILYQPLTQRLSQFLEARNGNPACSVSLKFAACPAWAQCEEGSTNFTYAEIQPHRKADVRDLTLGGPLLEDFYSLEELPGPQPGSIWRRGIWWGYGKCQCVEFGSYLLKKVIDANGNPLEPYYTEFVNFMGATPMKLWSGVVDSAWLRAPPAR